MNIFVLSLNPIEAAQMMCDKHVVKMPLESAQLLSTALWHTGYKGVAYDSALWKDHWDQPDRASVIRAYTPTHENHPQAKWSCFKTNYMWLHRHAMAACAEHTYRYGTVTHLERMLTQLPTFDVATDSIPSSWYQAMPDDVKSDDVVEAYRNYYIRYKRDICAWTKRQPPSWYTEGLTNV